MTVGAGKYDPHCTHVLDAEPDATGCIVIVLGPDPGFAVQVADPRMLFSLPGLMRAMADQIEADVKKDVKAHTQ